MVCFYCGRHAHERAAKGQASPRPPLDLDPMDHGRTPDQSLGRSLGGRSGRLPPKSLRLRVLQSFQLPTDAPLARSGRAGGSLRSWATRGEVKSFLGFCGFLSFPRLLLLTAASAAPAAAAIPAVSFQTCNQTCKTQLSQANHPCNTHSNAS